MKKLILLTVILLTTAQLSFSQADSVIFKNGNTLVGAIKSLNRSILVMETPYSDADFTIKWEEIKELYANTFFLITLSDGSRHNGTILSSTPGKINIKTDEGKIIPVLIDEIVNLDDMNKGFWNQIYASIDFGFDLTKANNFRQFSMRSNLGYMAKRWQLDGNYSALTSYQSNTPDIERNEGSITYKYFLPKDWYPLASMGFLSNSQQSLSLRTTGKLGLGKYIIHTNRVYWGLMIGANYNMENYYQNTSPDRESWEGFAGMELNMFNVGDFSLITNLIIYPSLTESKRLRTDFRIDSKYDLPLDFYIKVGLNINFDNQPALDASKTDYIFSTGFGWEW